MKKLFLLTGILFLLLSSAVKAQDKGQFWLSGTFSAWASKVEDLKTTNFKIIPEAGYQFHNNWGFGLQVGFVKTETARWYFDGSYDVLSRINFRGCIVAPFVRYSFLKRDVCNLFTDISFGYSYMKQKDFDYTINTYEAGLRPGVSFRFHEKLAFIGKVGFIGYQGERHKYDRIKSESNSGGLDLDLSQIQLGLIFTL